MLKVRDWRQSDMQALADFHHQMAVGYSLPNNFGPLYAVRKVVVDENDNPVAFATVKIISEAYFWVDPKVAKTTRARGLAMLHTECKAQCETLGLDETSCWVPPGIAKWFSTCLEKLGWRKSPWPNWSILLK